ncbi:unnamed protein product [Acanthoscelides obtectus]|uniref:Uncharacterized protein n=1 Tax=Acanthoscelides obtectus TaxID=200917 RepID=A0A9P0VVV4_ACAOB|nr:unnamed protein product [Acanthoscelides obtectus]CAK1686836.1 hypothetical protein AOBTE_LOCUS36089 [Acanthoscelides obtectus]
MTKESAPGSRYQLGRLREPSLLESIRLYLAYLHDKSADVALRAKPAPALGCDSQPKAPARREELLNLYKQFYLSYGLSEADADLRPIRTTPPDPD